MSHETARAVHVSRLNYPEIRLTTQKTEAYLADLTDQVSDWPLASKTRTTICQPPEAAPTVRVAKLLRLSTFSSVDNVLITRVDD